MDALSRKAPTVSSHSSYAPYNMCQRIAILVALAVIFPVIPLLYFGARNWLLRKFDIVTGKVNILDQVSQIRPKISNTSTTAGVVSAAGVLISAKAAESTTVGAPSRSFIEDTAWLNILPRCIFTHHNTEVHALRLETGEEMWATIEEPHYTLHVKSINPLETIEILFSFNRNFYQIQSATLNGVKIEINRLNNSGDLLYKKVNSFFNAILIRYGIEATSETLRLHPLAIERYPEIVLKNIAQLIRRGELPRQVNFLMDNFKNSPGIDGGALSTEFMDTLGLALFSKDASKRAVHIMTEKVNHEDEPIPVLNDNPTDQTLEVYKDFGTLISHILTCPSKRLGIVLNQQFFYFLKEAVRANGNYDALLIGLRRIQIPSNDQTIRPVLDWITNPNGTPVHIRQYLNLLSIDAPRELSNWDHTSISTDELVDGIKETLKVQYEKQAKAVLAVLEGLTSEALAYFSREDVSGEVACERIQGTKITADLICEKLHTSEYLITQSQITSEQRAVFETRFGWIREQIQAKRDDNDWLKKFVILIVGNSVLTRETFLHLAPAYYGPGWEALPDIPKRYNFYARTCSSKLEIPLENPTVDGYDEKTSFLCLLDVALLDSRNFTAP